MQEVIIYRNPAEAALWNAIMGGSFFPVIVGIVVFFCVFLTANRLLNKGRSFGVDVPRNTNIALAIGVVAGAVAVFFLA